MLEEILSELKREFDNFEKGVKEKTGMSIEELAKIDTDTKEGQRKMFKVLNDLFSNDESKDKEIEDISITKSKDGFQIKKTAKNTEDYSMFKVKEIKGKGNSTKGCELSAQGRPGDVMFIVSVGIANYMKEIMGMNPKKDEKEIDEFIECLTSTIKSTLKEED